MERSATISLSEGTLQQEQVLPSQAVFGAVLDRVLANHPLEDVLKTSATLMELHLGLSDCSVRVPGSASPAEAARKVRDLRSADGALLATVSASSDVKDAQAENQLDQVCRILAHALEHEKLRAEVQRQAMIDSVTGLVNREAFEDAIAAALPDSLAVIWLGLDRFKEVNESLGHAAGDELLRKVAERLRAEAPPMATLGRMGGDEFALVVPGANQEGAAALAQRLVDRLSPQFVTSGSEVYVTASVGISVGPEHGATAAELQQNADTAMYEAKCRGRGSVVAYTSAAGEAARTRLELGRDMRRALTNKEFELHFQPQVDLEGEVRCFEALVRWRHPVKGMLLPGSFIDLAEETGLIVPLGVWVMEEACRKCALWNAHRETPVKVAVNVSALQFYGSDMAQVVRGALERSNLAPELLEIELTESLLLRDSQKCIEDLASLRNIGVSLAIDDFGAGYSCLSYLQRLPVDVLKIDRSFFLKHREEKSTTAVVAAITGMAHGLGLQVVAEGIEEPHQMAVLRRLRVDLVQGYLFGRPRPIADAEHV